MAVEILTETPIIPSSTLGPYRHADYLELPDEPRCELIYGRFYLMPPPELIHQIVAGFLCFRLDAIAVAAGGLAVIAPMAVLLADHSTVEPDVTYVSSERLGIARRWIEGVPSSVLKTILDLSALVGGAIAVYTFWRNGRLKRAEWLYNLHAKFYESDEYKLIRRLIDYQPEPDFSNLREALTIGGRDELAEAMVDYLNFFELIASLWRLRQLSTREIAMVFEYYIIELNDHDFIMKFISTQGFENLVRLVAVIAQYKRRGAAV